MTESEIQKLEGQNGVKFPLSYKTFLQEFGDGAYWLYGRQPMDSATRPFWLKALRPQTPDMIPVDGDNLVPRDSLLCLMTEDSNGGSWCWLTSEPDADGEWPLAYYEQFEGKLFYKVATFADWLNILINNRSEVIRVLDEEGKLDLG